MIVWPALLLKTRSNVNVEEEAANEPEKCRLVPCVKVQTRHKFIIRIVEMKIRNSVVAAVVVNRRLLYILPVLVSVLSTRST